MRKKSGQALVVVLLVVVVALAVGLSVATRNITNIKTATQTERSQRAFSAAEGGIENVLSKLDTIVSSDPAGVASSAGHNESVPVDTANNINASVNIKASQNYSSLIDLGFVGQIDLDPAKTTAAQVKIEWAQSGETDSDGPASIEVIQYYQEGQTREAYTGGARTNESGFASPSNCPTAGFLKCTVVNVAPTAGSFRYLRIRPFWVRATIQVSGQNGAIPLQNFDLASTAQTPEGITRKVQVTKSALPSLPAAFDYAVYSSGSIIK